ncbi:hypothetical protein [Thioalkalivibrio sp. HK1]|uniref:hypothetical protein n=1 Tax=Thioalkalivibrio sp. HK1 TaxID=1469245 RepID=UPI000470A6D3|nr:hypothetical protein [Thioalkalivibrio sp. HK1]
MNVEKAPYIFIAAMDVDPEKEALFHEVYDSEHVPALLEVPGVIWVRRLQACDFSLAIGAGLSRIERGQTPRWHALYGIESPEVLKSAAWSEAIESGRWSSQVRPFTRHRRHTLLHAMPPCPDANEKE